MPVVVERDSNRTVWVVVAIIAVVAIVALTLIFTSNDRQAGMEAETRLVENQTAAQLGLAELAEAGARAAAEAAAGAEAAAESAADSVRGAATGLEATITLPSGASTDVTIEAGQAR